MRPLRAARPKCQALHANEPPAAYTMNCSSLLNAPQSGLIGVGVRATVYPRSLSFHQPRGLVPSISLAAFPEQNTTPMHESPMAEGLSARDFLERELRANPDVSFAEVQERGRRSGLNIPPFLYGSARRALGLPSRRDLIEPGSTTTAPAPNCVMTAVFRRAIMR